MANECEDNHILHVHPYTTESDVALAHQHMIIGTSGPVQATAKSHVHRIRIRTSYLVEGNAGHWHWVDIMTAEATDMPDGATHVHYFSGTTSYDVGHEHTFSGSTGIGPGDPPDYEYDNTPLPPSHYKYKHGKRPEDTEDDE